MADAPPFYLYEVLYRGQPPGSDVAPDFHVILAAQGKDAFGNMQTGFSQALTPDQAKALGFDLPAILSSINTAVLAHANDLGVRLETEASIREDLEARHAQIERLAHAAGEDLADNAHLKAICDLLSSTAGN